MVDRFKKWFQSGMEPENFPPIPDSPSGQKVFLSRLVDYLCDLSESEIESAIGKVTGALAGKVEGRVFNDILNDKISGALTPKKKILLGEMAVDFLIKDENWLRTIDLLGQLIQIAQEISDDEELSILFNYRGVSLYRLVKYPDALRDLEESLKFADKINSDRRRARARINLGLVYKEMGRLEDAASNYKIALKLARENSDERTVLSCYLNIGNIYKELKRWDDGRNALLKGIDFAKEIGDSTEEIRGRLNLGVLYLDEGAQFNVARELFEGVIKDAEDAVLGDIARANLALTLIRLGTPEESLKYSERSLEDALRNADHEGIWRSRAHIARAYSEMGDTDTASDYYELALKDFDVLRKSLVSDRDRAEIQRTQRNLHGEYIEFCLNKIGTEKAFSILAESKQRALKELVDRRKGISGSSGDDVYKKILGKLGRNPDDVIVDYFIWKDSLAIFTCDESGVTVHESHNVLDSINKLIREFTSQIGLFIASREYRESEWKNDVDPPDPLIKLGEILISPIMGRIAGKKHLAVVPHGILHNLPFSALVDRDRKYLIESHTVTQIPSSDFYLYENDSDGKRVHEINVIRGKFDDLPGTDREIKSLGEIFGNRMHLSDTNILKAGKLSGILHFAGHAEFDISDPFSSALLLPGGDRLTVQELIDGGIDLKDVSLVVLSACETGVGKVLEGDEVIGIARAFLGSGAGSVIMSLWKVSDDITSILIPLFYGDLETGIPSSEALCNMMVTLLKERRVPPYFFAPFIMTSLG
ncbi:MAG: CHAT domain-containing tetratricopeptide repeat protein [bacterium]|nr:CHAT domain-containing tetratricopeptide repeat protein [bacterium]